MNRFDKILDLKINFLKFKNDISSIRVCAKMASLLGEVGRGL
jgi:hypothetical protein